MTPTEVIKWLEDCAAARASAFGPNDSSTLVCTEAAACIRNAMRVFREAASRDEETIARLTKQLAARSAGVSRKKWESLYDSLEAERAKRKRAEERLGRIVTQIQESAYYGSVVNEPRGAAKVLHEVMTLANGDAAPSRHE